MIRLKNANSLVKGLVFSVIITVAATFLLVDVLKVSNIQASVLSLPSPTEFVKISKVHSYPLLKGIRLDPADPLKIEFMIDTADAENVSEDEAQRSVNYFLSALTVPEEELWVNLSPYENDRIVPGSLGVTEMGRDLLAQDYILKQLMSSLTYPDSDTGKDFWQKAYEKLYQEYGTINKPVNTFNKVWIVPDYAKVVESGTMALITDSNLKVQLEEDYLAKSKNLQNTEINQDDIAKLSSQIMKDVVIPEIEDDVNYGKNFAKLRQVYNSLILASWFKKKFASSFYNYYIDKEKVRGIDTVDEKAKEEIFGLYVNAFKKGVYNYVKREKDPYTKKKINRHYFSGGFSGEISSSLETENIPLANIISSASEVSNAVKYVVRLNSELVVQPQSNNTQTEETEVSSAVELQGLMVHDLLSQYIKAAEKGEIDPFSKEAQVSINPVQGVDVEYQVAELNRLLSHERLSEMKRLRNKYGFLYVLKEMRNEYKEYEVAMQEQQLAELHEQNNEQWLTFETELTSLLEGFERDLKNMGDLYYKLADDYLFNRLKKLQDTVNEKLQQLPAEYYVPGFNKSYHAIKDFNHNAVFNGGRFFIDHINSGSKGQDNKLEVSLSLYRIAQRDVKDTSEGKVTVIFLKKIVNDSEAFTNRVYGVNVSDTDYSIVMTDNLEKTLKDYGLDKENVVSQVFNESELMKKQSQYNDAFIEEFSAMKQHLLVKGLGSITPGLLGYNDKRLAILKNYVARHEVVHEMYRRRYENKLKSNNNDVAFADVVVEEIDEALARLIPMGEPSGDNLHILAMTLTDFLVGDKKADIIISSLLGVDSLNSFPDYDSFMAELRKLVYETSSDDLRVKATNAAKMVNKKWHEYIKSIGDSQSSNRATQTEGSQALVKAVDVASSGLINLHGSYEKGWVNFKGWSGDLGTMYKVAPFGDKTGQYGVILTDSFTNIGPLAGIPEMFIYGRKNEQNEILLRGLYIKPEHRGFGNLNNLLSLFFDKYSDVKKTHSNSRNLILLDALTRRGFEPKDKTHKAYMRYTDGERSDLYLDSSEKELFKESLGGIEVDMYNFVDEKTDDFVEVYFATEYELKDKKQLQSKLAKLTSLQKANSAVVVEASSAMETKDEINSVLGDVVSFDVKGIEGVVELRINESGVYNLWADNKLVEDSKFEFYETEEEVVVDKMIINFHNFKYAGKGIGKQVFDKIVSYAIGKQKDILIESTENYGLLKMLQKYSGDNMLLRDILYGTGSWSSLGEMLPNMNMLQVQVSSDDGDSLMKAEFKYAENDVLIEKYKYGKSKDDYKVSMNEEGYIAVQNVKDKDARVNYQVYVLGHLIEARLPYEALKEANASSALEFANDAVGGIDLDNIDIDVDVSSSSLGEAPFDVESLAGFSFVPVTLEKLASAEDFFVEV